MGDCRAGDRLLGNKKQVVRRPTRSLVRLVRLARLVLLALLAGRPKDLC